MAQKISAKNRRTKKARLYSLQGGLCAHCGKPFVDLTAGTLEHIIPRSRGGADSYNNLLLACFPCNQRRGAQSWLNARAKAYHKHVKAWWLSLEPGTRGCA